MYFRNKFTCLYCTLFSSVFDVKLKCVCDLSEMLVKEECTPQVFRGICYDNATCSIYIYIYSNAIKRILCSRILRIVFSLPDLR